jgi:hypothetical protein
MTTATLLFGVLVASLYGALFHLMRGGSPARLLLYLALSWAGFTLGHLIGAWRNWILLPVGALDLGTGTVGSFLFLFVGHWLSLVEIRADRDDDAV